MPDDRPRGPVATVDAAPLREDDASRRSVRLLRRLFAGQPFAVRLWDGVRHEVDTTRPAAFTLVLRHPGALRRMLMGADELAVSESYLYDDIDVEGDLGALVEVAERIFLQRPGLRARLGHLRELLALPAIARPRTGRQPARLRGALHSRARDSQAIAYHYDVSNAFFALWLDARMVYSCAYFEHADDDLERAQVQKLDHVCRKLRLKPGQRFLDIGCGWGALAMHAARHYGVDAHGVTLSARQVELANERIRAAGLAERCRVERVDYRELAKVEPFDRIASVGMFEHVGETKLGEYFRQVHGLLRPGGLFLNHAIALVKAQPERRGNTFFDRYVFPDGRLVPLSSALRAAEANDFEIRDVEALREHYEKTLRHWIHRLETHHDQAASLADEVTYRVWRLYISLAAHQFRLGRTTLYQTLLCRPADGASGLPLTRADWYPGPGHPTD